MQTNGWYVLCLFQILTGLDLNDALFFKRTINPPSNLLKEENGRMILEGDIIIPTNQVKWIHKQYGMKYTSSRKVSTVGQQSAVAPYKQQYWKQVNGMYYEVPYEVGPSVGSNMRAILETAILRYHKLTCLRFVPRKPNQHFDYIKFIHDAGCSSPVGRQGGQQPLILQNNGCEDKGKVIHEMMHSIGFYHEQSRPDRNDYIEVLKANILLDDMKNFNRMEESVTSGTPYDFESVMHYKLNEFAIPGSGLNTLRPKIPNPPDNIGNRQDFSVWDVAEINRLYPCEPCKDTTIWPIFCIQIKNKGRCNELDNSLVLKCKKTCNLC